MWIVIALNEGSFALGHSFLWNGCFKFKCMWIVIALNEGSFALGHSFLCSWFLFRFVLVFCFLFVLKLLKILFLPFFCGCFSIFLMFCVVVLVCGDKEGVLVLNHHLLCLMKSCSHRHEVHPDQKSEWCYEGLNVQLYLSQAGFPLVDVKRCYVILIQTLYCLHCAQSVVMPWSLQPFASQLCGLLVLSSTLFLKWFVYNTSVLPLENKLHM